MYDTFSAFGNILSCKVATDESSNSKGYGFVHFETEEAANQAISKVNGMLLSNKPVYVGKFIPRSEREKELGEKAKRYNNVFVKNFADNLDDEKLKEMFSEYGKITSHKVMFADDGKNKGFGFVAFENPSEAEKAVNALNGKEINGKPLYVGRAQKKQERLQELKKKFEQIKMERNNRYQGVNLYIKNLDDSIDDDKLRKEFAGFGTITSAKVMMEDGRSKGFGFVCFSSPEEATKAVTDMNGRILVSKPLYVALAQRREDRKAHLASQYMQRVAGMRMQQMGQMYQPSGASYFMPQMPQAQRYYNPQMAQARAATSRWPPQQPGAQIRSAQVAAGFQMQPSPYRTAGPRPTQAGPRSLPRPMAVANQQQVAGLMGNVRPGAVIQAANPAVAMAPNAAAAAAAAALNSAAGYKYTTNMRNPPTAAAGAVAHAQGQVGQPSNTAGLHLNGQDVLTPTMLASADPHEQKQMLGERLYPLISKNHPEYAGKITGMLLEIDNADLLHMLEDEAALKIKTDEAIAVLKAHSAKQQAQAVHAAKKEEMHLQA